MASYSKDCPAESSWWLLRHQGYGPALAAATASSSFCNLASEQKNACFMKTAASCYSPVTYSRWLTTQSLYLSFFVKAVVYFLKHRVKAFWKACHWVFTFRLWHVSWPSSIAKTKRKCTIPILTFYIHQIKFKFPHKFIPYQKIKRKSENWVQFSVSLSTIT